MSAAEIAAEVRAAAVEVAQEVGDGAELVGTIERTTGQDESTFPATGGTTIEYTFAAMFGSFKQSDREGRDISDRDVMVIVTRPVVSSAGAEIEPENGDKMSIDGHRYSIQEVHAVQPGGGVIMWRCRCRSGDL